MPGRQSPIHNLIRSGSNGPLVQLSMRNRPAPQGEAPVVTQADHVGWRAVSMRLRSCRSASFPHWCFLGPLCSRIAWLGSLFVLPSDDYLSLLIVKFVKLQDVDIASIHTATHLECMTDIASPVTAEEISCERASFYLENPGRVPSSERGGYLGPHF
jgi:hypothetical protein